VWFGIHNSTWLDGPLLMNSDRRNDEETRELFVSDVKPHFA
jgi:hypothetical protein